MPGFVNYVIIIQMIGNLGVCVCVCAHIVVVVDETLIYKFIKPY